jgi:hypothetical protein
MADSSSLRDDLVDSLETQVAALRKEVSSLRKSISRRGLNAYDAASDSAGDLYEGWMEALPHLHKRAKAVERTARDNPAAAVAAGVVVVGLLAMLFAKR